MSGTKRYINDVIFDRLCMRDNFKTRARNMMTADWRNGTQTFRDYVMPIIDEIFAEGVGTTWGDLSMPYLEDRFMSGLDPNRVRCVLHAIENGN